MGKDNRNRQRNKLNLRNSANPAGLVSASDIRKLRELDAEALSAGNSPAISMNENDGTTQTNIPRLVRELDSIHDFTRENACVSLAGIVLSGSDDNDGGGDNDDDDDALMTDRQRDLVQRVNSQLSHNDVIRLVLERGAAHKLSQKLCDPSCAVRIAAAGALRNLSIVGGYELCQRLQQDDIIMLIMAAMKKAVDSILELKKKMSNVQQSDAVNDVDEDGDEDAKKNKQVQRMEERLKEQLETAKEVISLLSILCEESPEATHGATQDANFIALIMHLIVLDQSDALAREVALSAAKCLQIVSDENRSLAKALEQNHEATKALFIMIGNANVTLQFRVVIAGILFNALSGLFNEATSSNMVQEKLKIVEHVYPTLMEAAQFESVDNLNKMISSLVQLANDERSETFDPETNEHSLLLNEWTSCVRAQTMSFEILTNIISFMAFCEDDSMDDEDFEDIDEEEVTADTITEDTMQQGNGAREELLQFVQQSQFIMHLVSCFGKSLSMHSVNMLIMSQPHGMRKVKQLYKAAVRCLNCLCSTMLATPSDELCKYDIDGLWNYAHNVLEKSTTQWQQIVAQREQQQQQQQSKTNDDTQQIVELLEEYIELITRLVWILSKKPQPSPQAAQFNIGKCSIFHSVSFDQAKLLAMLLQGTIFSEETRINCIGILGQLGQRPHTPEQNRALSDLIASKLGDPSLAFVSELLNAVFDIYKDRTHDAVLSETRLLQNLQIFATVFSNKLKQEQAKLKSAEDADTVDEEVLHRAKEASLNLSRFLTFKLRQK